MSSIDTKHAVLTAHPSTSNHAVRSLGVQLRAEVPDFLVFQYSLDADMSRVRVPLSGAGGRADALWQHTCFEAFVAPEDAPGYHEFNFSPSLDWAIYRFSAYREGMSPAEIGRAPRICVRQGDAVQHQLTGEPNRWIRLDEGLRRLGRQSALEETVRRPDGARTIAKRELHQLKHRLQKLPSAARANDKPT
jgi:hypothetical protein